MSMAADGRSTRWEAHRESRRRELVEATVRAIRAHGATVGMDDIAAAAGTSKTVFYRHFTDRSGLYAAVCEHVDALILRDLAAAVGHDDSGGHRGVIGAVGSPRDVVVAAIDSYLRLVERDPEVYRFVVNAPLLERASEGDPAVAVSGHIAGQVSAVLAEAMQAAGRDPSPAAVWGTGLVGMVRAAADRWLAEPASMSRAELARQLGALAWDGLSAAWPAGTRDGNRR
jgi:AcrR family transcriptional regulator